MSKKYELTDEALMMLGGITLRRIRALKDFANVKKGDLGGWIQSEENLSHDGNCWVYGDARVYANACVFDHAKVCGDVWVYDSARVCGEALVRSDAQVYGDARVYGNAIVHGNARVYESAQVYGDARVHGDARVYGDTFIVGNANIQDSACIASTSDHFVVGPIGSRDGFTTFYRSEEGIMVTCGCFKGSLEEFEKKVKETHGSNRYATQYLHVIECAKNLLHNHKTEN